MTVRKTIVINAMLAFTYTFLGALTFGPQDIGAKALLAAGVAGLRAVVGVIMEARGKTLPMDQVGDE